ncbi:MAG: hypothetical protein ABEL51_10010 [Salinibacter sp.]
MTDSRSYAETHTLAVAIVLGSIGLLLGGGESAVAQDRGRAPSMRSAPSQYGTGSAGQRRRADRSISEVPGTELPSAARPADPPAVGMPPAGRETGPRGSARTSAPGMEDSPAQAPIGGAKWLAAAGAAYALNRLRKRESSHDQDEDDR